MARSASSALSNYQKSRRDRSIRYAWRIRPYVLAMQDAGMTQRAMVSLLNQAGAAIPSEYEVSQKRPMVSTRGWTLVQLQRFLERVEQAGRLSWKRSAVADPKTLFRRPEVVAHLAADAAKHVAMSPLRAYKLAWSAAVQAGDEGIEPAAASPEAVVEARRLWLAHMAAAYYRIEELLGSDPETIRTAVRGRTLRARAEAGDEAAQRQLNGLRVRLEREAAFRDNRQARAEMFGAAPVTRKPVGIAEAVVEAERPVDMEAARRRTECEAEEIRKLIGGKRGSP